MKRLSHSHPLLAEGCGQGHLQPSKDNHSCLQSDTVPGYGKGECRGNVATNHCPVQTSLNQFIFNWLSIWSGQISRPPPPFFFIFISVQLELTNYISVVLIFLLLLLPSLVFSHLHLNFTLQI